MERAFISFNDQPYTLGSGPVCFSRGDDHHLFESVDRLNMINVLYHSPNGFLFLQDIAPFLPGEGRGSDRFTGRSITPSFSRQATDLQSRGDEQ